MGLVQQTLEKGMNVQKLYVDTGNLWIPVLLLTETVGDPDKYKRMLSKKFPSIKTIVVAKKADSKYPIVSAASICAKVLNHSSVFTYIHLAVVAWVLYVLYCGWVGQWGCV